MQRTTKGLVWTAALTTISAFPTQANAVNKVFFDNNGVIGAGGSLTASGWTSIGTMADVSTAVASGTASGGSYWNLADASTTQSMKFINSTNMSQTSSRNFQMARIRVNSGTDTPGTFGQSVSNTALVQGTRVGALTLKDGQGGSSNMPGNAAVVTSGWRIYAFSWLGVLSATPTIKAWYLNDVGVLATGGQWSSNPAHWTQAQTVSGLDVSDLAVQNTVPANVSGFFLGTSTGNSAQSNIDVDWVGWTRDDFGGLIDGSDGGGIDDGNQQLPWNVTGVPVPEPMTLSMLALGAIPMMMRRRRVA